MERERDVHREFPRRLGLASTAATCQVEVIQTVDDGMELF
jgi:hypothetical protein